MGNYRARDQAKIPQLITQPPRASPGLVGDIQHTKVRIGNHLLKYAKFLLPTAAGLFFFFFFLPSKSPLPLSFGRFQWITPEKILMGVKAKRRERKRGKALLLGGVPTVSPV
jgi:hypothetical protein